MANRQFGKIDLSFNDSLALEAFLGGKPTVDALAAQLVLADAQSRYVSERIRQLDDRGDYILLEEAERKLPDFTLWMEEASRVAKHVPLVDRLFAQRFGGEDFNVVLKVPFGSYGSEAAIVVPKHHKDRNSYETLVSAGVAISGAKIDVKERLDALLAPVVKKLAKSRGHRAVSKAAAITYLARDTDFRRVFDANSDNFFKLTELGFEQQEYEAHFGAWQALAAIVIFQESIDPESHLR